MHLPRHPPCAHSPPALHVPRRTQKPPLPPTPLPPCPYLPYLPAVLGRYASPHPHHPPATTMAPVDGANDGSLLGPPVTPPGRDRWGGVAEPWDPMASLIGPPGPPEAAPSAAHPSMASLSLLPGQPQDKAVAPGLGDMSRGGADPRLGRLTSKRLQHSKSLRESANAAGEEASSPAAMPSPQGNLAAPPLMPCPTYCPLACWTAGGLCFVTRLLPAACLLPAQLLQLLAATCSSLTAGAFSNARQTWLQVGNSWQRRC